VSHIEHDGPAPEEERDPDAPTPESVEPGEQPAAPDPDGVDDSALEAGEGPGLGLTDEFARIEAEIAGDEEGAEPPGPDQPEAPPPTDEEWVVAEGQTDADAPAQPADGDGSGQGDPEQQEDSDATEASDATEVFESTDQAAAGPSAAAAAGAGERPDQADAGGPPPTQQPPIVRPTTPPPASVAPLPSDDELESVASNLWLRFLSGSVLIVASIAAAVAVVGLLFVEDIAAKLQPIPGVSEQLASIEPDEPQTILIIGSDRRAGDDPDAGARSDTTMLLRVDADKEVLSLFSLPRDLKVDVPGIGPAKLNEAYAAGGEKKTLKTVKRFTGLEINHVVEINFNGFADAVDAIDCVYIDVDREYFNVNDGTVANDYAEIDINAGYQRLCGLKALQYVRYRHFDTDLVRAARQQDFLREARQKIEPRELLGAVAGIGIGTELIDIFTKYTRSDIDSAADVLGILKSFAAVQDAPVNEVHFEGDIGGPDDPFVTSTDEQVQKAIDEFLNGVGSSGQRGGEKSNKKKGKKKGKKKKKKGGGDADVIATETLADEKFPTLADRFKADADKNARRLGIPVFYPTEVVPGSTFSKDSRTYEYENEDNKKESAYKTVIALTTPSTLTEYYGVMGTTWEDPPILRNPSEVREIDGRDYLLFYDGGRLRLVGWKAKGNSYWLNNTLVQSIGEAEMLAMATSMRDV
jgi:polyisoprenyl-teichoic acid--peptidoglycan teichoic acid transferase